MWESLAKIVNDLRGVEPEEEPLSERATALSKSISELRDMYAA
jgi:hypothetical protein